MKRNSKFLVPLFWKEAKPSNEKVIASAVAAFSLVRIVYRNKYDQLETMNFQDCTIEDAKAQFNDLFEGMDYVNKIYNCIGHGKILIF